MNRTHKREDGLRCDIEPSSFEVMKPMLKEFKPQLIVEFGTLKGGFIKYMAEWYPEVPKYTVDAFWVLEKREANFFRGNNVGVLITGQLFKNELLLPILLSLPLRKFLMCDNGSKTVEILKYAGYLRPGDILAAHDWSSEINITRVEEEVLQLFSKHPIEIDEKIVDCRFFVRRSYEHENICNPNRYVEK